MSPALFGVSFEHMAMAFEEANSYRMSRLSLESEGDDADVEASSEDEESRSAAKRGGGGMRSGGLGKEDDEDSGTGVASMPGTPIRSLPGRDWVKEYASETEARGGGGGRRRRHGRRRRERCLERAWQLKKSHAAAEDGSDAAAAAAAAAAEYRVVVRPRCGSGRMRMDMEEVRACRDLGIGLPADWTVEIPETFSDLTADTSSGGNSPVSWRISSPGTDPNNIFTDVFFLTQFEASPLLLPIASYPNISSNSW